VSKHHSTDRIRRRKRSEFKGTPIVPGIALGVVRIKFRRTQVLSDRVLEQDEVPREHERLKEAVRRAKASLIEDRTKVATSVGEVEATIFDAHIAILEDHGFLRKVEAQVAKDLKPVDVVVASVVEGFYRTLSMVQDEHLRERAADIRDVGRRLLDNLAELAAPGDEERDIEPGDEGDVIFARELLPSDLVALERRHCQAVACEIGSERGHAAVILRAMNLPAVIGLHGLSDVIEDGDFIIVDASTGTVIVNPKREQIDRYTRLRDDYEHYQAVLRSEVALPARTTDGQLIHLLANVSKESEIDAARPFGVDGVGLFRTELHLMASNHFPEEDELYRIYRDTVERSDGKPVTFRTMDLGSDKNLPYLKFNEQDHHIMGRRSIRLMAEIEEFQMVQLRAILRASAHGPVKLMFPFITTLEDIRLAKRMVRAAKRDLDLARRRYDAEVPIGMMVEIPAAALSLDKFVREVSFFSVGTNDLTQYVCAADRNHPEVAPWYKAHNPGMLNLLKIIADTAQANKAELTICGEMAGDPFYTMFLLGLGIDRLSMSAPQIPLVKKIIRSVNMTGARNLTARALQLTSTEQIKTTFATTVQQILGRDLSSWSLEAGAEADLGNGTAG
jgi:phosphotransferase system enzyme I (PtsI)